MLLRPYIIWPLFSSAQRGWIVPTQVLVTGCAGFIGSHLCEHLIANGISFMGLYPFHRQCRISGWLREKWKLWIYRERFRICLIFKSFWWCWERLSSCCKRRCSPRSWKHWRFRTKYNQYLEIFRSFTFKWRQKIHFLFHRIGRRKLKKFLLLRLVLFQCKHLCMVLQKWPGRSNPSFREALEWNAGFSDCIDFGPTLFSRACFWFLVSTSKTQMYFQYWGMVRRRSHIFMCRIALKRDSHPKRVTKKWTFLSLELTIIVKSTTALLG